MLRGVCLPHQHSLEAGQAIHQAITLDPLSSVVLRLEELHEMTEELLEAKADILPVFS